MAVIQFRKAERKKAKLRLGIAGPAGSGKTYSALLIAMGLGEKIALIDTEHESGSLYAHLCDYDTATLEAPFTPDKYIQAIKAAEEAGYGTIIIDSLTHAWAGEGGLLDVQGKIVDSGKANSYTAWRFITPKHNALVEAILQSKCHVIATMRSKMEYAMQDNNGKKEIQKVGMGAIQRDGMEYEFTLFLELNQKEHTAEATKDRTSLFDGNFFVPSPDTGKKLLAWLESGTDAKTGTAAGIEAKAEDTVIDIARRQTLRNPSNNNGTTSHAETQEEQTHETTAADPKPEKEEIKEITEEERVQTIIEAMRQVNSEDDLKRSCDTYRADYDLLSEKDKAAVLKEKKVIKARIKKAAA